MKTSKSKGGRNRVRKRNSDSAHKRFGAHTKYFSNVRKYAPLHRDLAKTQMMRDAEVVELALKLIEEYKPFEND